MKITQARLKQILKEEIRKKLLNEIIHEEMFLLLLEQEDLSSQEEDAIDQWKKSQSLRGKVKQFAKQQGRNFNNLSTGAKIAAIVAVVGMGAAGLGASSAISGYEDPAAGAGEAFASSLQVGAERAQDISAFADLAVANAADGQGADDMEEFKEMHADQWEDAGEILSPGFGLKAEPFVQVPADQIPDNEVLPFAKISKADYQELLKKSFFSSGVTDQNLKMFSDFVGGNWKPGSSALWGYTAGGYAPFAPEADSGSQGQMLPPEWSVAYELLLDLAAGPESPPDKTIQLVGGDLDPMQGASSWDIKEIRQIIQKELAKLA